MYVSFEKSTCRCAAYRLDLRRLFWPSRGYVLYLREVMACPVNALETECFCQTLFVGIPTVSR